MMATQAIKTLKLEVIAKDPAYVIQSAVKGILPKNKLTADRLSSSPRLLRMPSTLTLHRTQEIK